MPMSRREPYKQRIGHERFGDELDGRYEEQLGKFYARERQILARRRTLLFSLLFFLFIVSALALSFFAR